MMAVTGATVAIEMTRGWSSWWHGRSGTRSGEPAR